MDVEGIVSWAIFLGVIVLFFVDHLLAIRVIGIYQVAGGCWIIWKRDLPYGIKGQPPSGSLSGWMAVTAGVVILLIGALFIAVPESIDNVVSRRR